MKTKNIVGLDIGNINTKIKFNEVQEVFSSRIFEVTSEGDLLNSDEIVTIDNKKYIVGTCGEYENNNDKYTKSNYLVLLKYAIAKYVMEENIYLSVGLPISHYNKSDVTMLKNKILNNRSFEVDINGLTTKHFIKDISIIPESFGIYDSIKHNQLFNTNTNTLIIDIGGGTTDISYINATGKYEHQYSHSIDIGLLDFYRSVSDSIYTSCNKLRLNIEDTKEFCRGITSYIGVHPNIKSECEVKTFNRILNELKGKYNMINHSNIIVVGGGSEVFATHFKNVYHQTIELNNIHLNSNVFYNVGVKRFNEGK